MDISQLIPQYKRINEYFDSHYPSLNGKYRLLARLGKITEELGELNSAVHSELGIQREEKQKNHSFDQVELEWADLFNTTMIFGLSMDIDIEKVIEKRLQQINQRYGITEKSQRTK